MKRNGLIVATILAGLFLNGCSNKELKVDKTQVAKVEKTKIEKVTEQTQNDQKVAVEILPASENKLKVVTKVKPKVTEIIKEKVNSNEVPLVVVDPVKTNDPASVKEVEILPVLNNTATVVTKAEPVVEVVEEIPVDETENAAVVIDPVVE